MELFRVFDWDGASLGRSEGGPLCVARSRQGAGRHDSPAQYGAWYCSRLAVSAIAECIQYLRGHVLRDGDFVRANGRTKALVMLRLDDALPIVDLDDPAALVRRRLRPSQVATLRRAVTQRIAASVFREGAGGLSWWSTLDAEWTNVTLFHERALPHIVIAAPPRMLSTRLAEVREAAAHLGVQI
ncbi:MAG: RES family NAD+ phosphorylase [Acidobacteria bacterium]|nr:RES family NAD+ phosphorylase [Acidobacteriota bacterium]